MKIVVKLMITSLSLLLSLSSFAAETIAPAADNSARNKRDDSVTEMTADNQSNDTRDVELTRKIRTELVSKKDFSTYAKNIKIIVIGNQIILKGPVRLASEKGSIALMAHKMAPNHKVQNELEVVTK